MKQSWWVRAGCRGTLLLFNLCPQFQMNVSLSKIGFCNLWTRESILNFYFACKQMFKLCIYTKIPVPRPSPHRSSFSHYIRCIVPFSHPFLFIFFFRCWSNIIQIEIPPNKMRTINFILIPFVPYVMRTVK